MSKLFKCDLCNRVFSRKEHLIRHANRKIKCINPINPVLNYDDVMNEEQNKYLQDQLTSNNIIVKKIGGDHNSNNLLNLPNLPNLYPNISNIPEILPKTNQDIKVVNMDIPKQDLKEDLKELHKPIYTELPKPTNTDLPKPTNTELPKPTNTDLPKQELTELPKQELTELPKQELKEELNPITKPKNIYVIPPNLPKNEFTEMTQEIKKKFCKSKTASKNRVVKEKKPLTSKEKEFFKNEFDNIKMLNALKSRYTEDELKNRYLKTLNIFELKNFKNNLMNDLNEEYKRHGIKQITDIDNLNESINEYIKYKNKIKILGDEITLAEKDFDLITPDA